MLEDTNFPRPQLRRTDWRDLGGVWEFAHDDHARWRSPDEVTFDRKITVPFPPESPASGVHETGFHPVVWYRLQLQLSGTERPHLGERRLLLHFGAVDYRASVWVNGQLVAQHEGGHTPFSADISAQLGQAQECVIVVRAEDDPHDLSQPRGKQDWKETPHAIWYYRTSGIWQPVWLEWVPDTHVTALRWTPDLDRKALRLEVQLASSRPQGWRTRVSLSLRGQFLTEQTVTVTSSGASMTLDLDHLSGTYDDHELYWSPRTPNLIDAVIEVMNPEGEVVDTVTSYAGLRSAAVTGGRFLLNGVPFYLRLVLAQNYWPESHLAAPSPEHLRREVELARDLGFNGVRIHQKIEDPRFLYWCDRLGLVVWGEAANAFQFTRDAQERLTREWLEALRRDASHPCIVAWVPLNESWGVPNLERDPAQRHFVKALYHLTRSLDLTRPVVANDGWEHVAGDIVGIHDYAVDAKVLYERYGNHEQLEQTLASVQPLFRNILTAGHQRSDEAVMLTEFGGLSIRPKENEQWWGYATVGTSEALLSAYDTLVSAVLESTVLMGFCYTQLTDTAQESNGLLRADRTPKVEPAQLRIINQRPSRAVPGEVIHEIHQQAQQRADTQG